MIQEHLGAAVRVAIAALLPLVGLALGALARRSLGPTPRRANVLWCLSLVCAWLGLTCWPTVCSTLLDTVTHIRGLGHLATDTLITCSFVLQFAFTCTVGNGWTLARRAAIALYGVLVGLYIAEWAAVHAGADFYAGYAGRPPSMLAINLTLVALIVYAAGLGIVGYAPFLHRPSHGSERIMATGASIVFGLAGLYGILVLGQTVASALGRGSTEILSVTGPLMVTAGSIAVAVIWLLTGERFRRLRGYVHAVYALQEREAELDDRDRRIAQREACLDQREGDMIDLAVWVQDQLVQVHVEGDGCVIDDVATGCAVRGFRPYQRKVTLTATRLILLRLARVLSVPRYDLGLLPDEDEPDGVHAAADLARAVEEEQDFLSDVLRVLHLADPQPLPEGIESRVESPGWRHDAATLIADTLRCHDRRDRFA